jgi:hypothetical protein
MTAVMDVAYLDLPFVEHVPRREFLLRMSPPCWEDSCHDCQDPRCLDACHDDWPTPAVPRCRSCGYLEDDAGHLVGCSPQAAMRIAVLADELLRLHATAVEQREAA